MASSKPLRCGPCKKGKVSTKADIWCYNCDDGLCSPCASNHKKTKVTRDHKTINILAYKNYKPPIASIKTECDKHSLPFNLYCLSHLMPCCEKCVSTSHSKCTGIKSLASIVEKTKTDKSKEYVGKNIDSVLNFLNKMANSKSKNLKRGEKQYENIKKSVNKVRKEINDHLDYLEKKLSEEVDTEWGKEKLHLTGLITEIEEKMKNLEEMKDNLNTVTQLTSKLQSFLGVHQIEQQVHQCQQYIEDIENNKRGSAVDIKLKQCDEMEKILKELQSLKSYGEVRIVKTETSMTRSTSGKREAQVEAQNQFNINNMTMHMEEKITINMMTTVSDLICLMDGRVIAVESMGQVSLFASDGKLQKQLPIPGKASSATVINQDTIAITYPNEKTIKIFNITNETVTKVIKFNKLCWGLEFNNNCLAVGLSDDEFRIIDLDGNTMKSIEVQNILPLTYFLYRNHKVIYIKHHDKTVYCIDESGNQIWNSKHVLSSPDGLCHDIYGNIIVADSNSGTITVISKDGQDSKALLKCQEMGFDRPRCICLKNNDYSGFISAHNGMYMAKFHLSYE